MKNARLTAKQARQGVLPRLPGREPAPVEMLGEGVDAILVRMDPRGAMPDCPHARDQVRLLRYLRARGIFVTTDRDLQLLDLRRRIGTAFQMAWREGKRTFLAFGRPIDIATHRPARAVPQRQAFHQ